MSFFFFFIKVTSLKEKYYLKWNNICASTLSVNHSSVHNSGYDAVVKVIHFQSDALEDMIRG